MSVSDIILEIVKHLPGLHDQASHAGDLKQNEIVTGRGKVYSIDAVVGQDDHNYVQKEIDRTWSGYARKMATYALNIAEGLDSEDDANGWILRDKGELVGIAALGEFIDEDENVKVEGLSAKHPPYGVVLMRQIAGLAAESGYGISLHSRSGNAAQFYESIGMVNRSPRAGAEEDRKYTMSKEATAEFAKYRGA